jgi:aryl-alcohol dehydrogenase-like predicted oxidoreductase
MFKRDIEKEILPFCKKNNIGVIVYSPLQKGMLSGKFTAESVKQLPPDDVRNMDPNYKSPRLEINLKAIEKFTQIAKHKKITMAQLATAWVIRNSEVTAAIAGARRKGQINETAPAADITLTKNEIDEIEEILSERDRMLK